MAGYPLLCKFLVGERRRMDGTNASGGSSERTRNLDTKCNRDGSVGKPKCNKWNVRRRYL